MLTLTVFRGDRIVQELDLEGQEVVIGRHSDNHVVLPDDGKGISRVHAMLRVEDGNYVLYDRNSQNGTYVDGVKIKREILQNGQAFVIGPYRLVLNIADVREVDPGAVVTMLGEALPGEPLVPEPLLPSSSASASIPLPQPPPSPSGVREGTANRAPSSRTHTQPSQSPPRAVSGTAPGWLQQQPRAVIYGGGAALVVLLGLLTWAVWPSQSVEDVVAVDVPATTSIPVTTTVPAVPTVDQRIVDARAAIEAAEQSMIPAEGSKPVPRAQFEAAAAALDAAIKNYLEPVLAETPNHAEAIDLQARATERLTYARQQSAQVATAQKTTTTVTCGDPDGVVRRTGESCSAYETRNADAKSNYTRGRALLSQENWVEAVRLWTQLSEREPDFRDATTYRRIAEDGLDKARRGALADADRLQGAALKLIAAGRIPEAAADLVSAGDAFERARQLGAPGADKMLGDNLQHRRQAAKKALGDAYSNANAGNIPEARRLIQTVIMLLPAGDPLSAQAVADLKKIEPTRE